MKRLSGVFLLLALGACTTASLVETAYPGRETFTFASNDGVDAMTYACEPGATEAETATRARQAHAFTQSELDRIANTAADRMIAGIEADAPAVATSFDISRSINRETDAVIASMDGRFACVLVDITEI